MRATCLAVSAALVLAGFSLALAQEEDPKDREIRVLKATVAMQARQIKALLAEVDTLKKQLAGAAPAASPKTSEPAAPAGQTVPAQTALKRKLGKLQFVNTPLKEVIAELRIRLGTTIVVDPAASDALKTPITLSLSDISGEAALAALLESARTPSANLGFEVRNGAVVISTQKDLASKMVTRTYNVRVLIGPQGPNQAGKSAQVLEIIKTNVAPDTWAPQGQANIQVGGENLIIFQTEKSHAAIAQLLKALQAKSTAR